MNRVELMRTRMETWVRERQLVPDHYAPDFVWDMSRAEWPGASEYHGIEGLRQFFAEWLDAWDDWTYEVVDVLEGTGGRVVVVGIQRAVNRAAGVPVEMRMGQVWTIDDDGRFLRMDMYTDPEPALADAGVRSA